MGISNTQYRDIMYEYDNIRMKNQRILDERYEELYKKIPELRKVQDEIIELSAAQARFELLHNEEAEQSNSEYLIKKQKLVERKLQLIKENGYPDDYL
ncbi:MAG: DNA replication protein DnaC, partial [Lachnospiraceae bacterium]|nr:DNA replication protein DnaC [Lachnospiraceae bacterium]